MAPVGAHAQSVDECMAELKKVQAYIENQSNQDRPELQHATELLVHAEFSASKGEGKKCVEFVTEAKGASGYRE
jgi:hypothetical protein